MGNDEQGLKRFLEEQLEWCRRQDQLLAEIEGKYYEMKEIAEYAASTNLSPEESVHLNGELYRLKQEIQSLEYQLQGTAH